MKQVSMKRLMTDTKVPRLGVLELFPDGMHRYLKGGDPDRGRYMFRFDNGLGAVCFIEGVGLEDQYVVYYVKWDSNTEHDTDYRAHHFNGKTQEVVNGMGQMNGLLHQLKEEKNPDVDALVVEPLILIEPGE